MREKRRVYVGFICLEKAYMLSGIKIMYIHSLACVRVKEGVSEGFRIDSGVR